MAPPAVFGLQILKKFPELIPLVTIIGTAVVGCSSFMAYSLATKPDVRFVKSRGQPHEDVAPHETRKLVITKPEEYKAIPELESLRKEIGRFETKK